MKDTDIEKIKVDYEDGEVIELEKGAVVSFKSDIENDELKVIIEMLNIGPGELRALVLGMVDLGSKMGIFDELEGE